MPAQPVQVGCADDRIAQRGNGVGALIVGENGSLYSKGDYADAYQMLGVEEPKNVEFEKSPGHFEEWVNAIRGEKPATSNFQNYAGGLTETILLGNLAVWAADAPETAGKKVEWDPKGLVATNAPELAEIVRPKYREGWKA